MADVVGWVAGPAERGTLSLIWSCLITIFACTWTVLHLNVPGLSDDQRTILLRKIKWMVINVLFPELILSKAICDLRLALYELLQFDAYLRDCKKDITWTVELECDSEVRCLEWNWEVENLSGWSSLLFDLFRLPQATPLRQQPDEHQPDIASSSTDALDSAELPAPLTGLKTNDSATCTEGERVPFVKACPQSEQLSRQEGPQMPGRVTQVHEHTEAGHRRPLEIHRAPLKEHRPHSTESNTCDFRADTTGKDRVGIGETDLEMGPNMQDRHVVGTKTTIASSQEEATGRPKTKENSKPRTWNHKDQKWTITHSYYAQMGGLVCKTWFYETVYDVELVTISELTTRVTDPKHEHPLKRVILAKEDIEDKSKADWFLKTLAILQVTWLVLNVIVRHATGLPITQLEVATVAFAIMAMLSYLANWWKPKDVSRPTVLQLRGNRSREHSQTTRYHRQSFMHRLWAPAKVERSANDREIKGERIQNDVVWLEGETPLLYYLMAGSSLVFGGLHCLAWDFEFPTRVELICWRAASVTSAVLPVVTLAVSALVGYLTTSYLGREFESKWMAELKAKFPDQSSSKWWDFFLDPQFFSSSWDEASLCGLYLRPEGSRNWEKPLPTGDPHVRVASGPDKAVLSMFKHRLSWFRTDLSSCMAGTATPSQWEWLSGRGGEVHPVLLESHHHLLEFWHDYENFAKGKLGDLKLPDECGKTRTFLEEIFKVTKNTASWAVTFEKRFRRGSNAVFIMSLIFYAASRLIILVILFTSLRAAPAGVYEDTAWTRFLPSFS